MQIGIFSKLQWKFLLLTYETLALVRPLKLVLKLAAIQSQTSNRDRRRDHACDVIFLLHSHFTTLLPFYFLPVVVEVVASVHSHPYIFKLSIHTYLLTSSIHF